MSLTLRSTALVVSSLAIMAGTASVAFASAGSTPPSGKAVATSSSSGKPSAVCITKTPNGIAVKACKPDQAGETGHAGRAEPVASAGSTPPSGRAVAMSSGSGKPSAVCVTKTPNGIAVKACKPTTPISLGKAHAQAG